MRSMTLAEQSTNRRRRAAPVVVTSGGQQFSIALRQNNIYDITYTDDAGTITIGAPIEGRRAAVREMREIADVWEYTNGPTAGL